MDGATHLPFCEQPEAFAALVGTFEGELFDICCLFTILKIATVRTG
jgi:hypothetical protein